MTQVRNALPQLSGEFFLTDGGLETVLIFQEGLDLPDFAAFDLLKNAEGEAALRTYFRTYAAIARHFGVSMILESATWRASADWGAKLGYTPAALEQVNRKAIQLLEEIRNEFENEQRKAVISGCIGPRGDGYNPGQIMSVAEAAAYHSQQIKALDDTLSVAGLALYSQYAVCRGRSTAATESDLPSPERSLARIGVLCFTHKLGETHAHTGIFPEAFELPGRFYPASPLVAKDVGKGKPWGWGPIRAWG